MLLPFELRFNRERKLEWPHKVSMWERETAYGACFIATNAEKEPERNGIFLWFSSDVY